MISRGDSEMHTMQMFALKQTMVCQETMFRKQVLELHRLYAIQKTMMQSFGYYEYLGHDLRNARDMSNLSPRTNLINLENIYQDKHMARGFSDFGQIGLRIVNNSTTKEESKSFDAGLLDLNEAYPDESSCNSNDPIVTKNHSPESSPCFTGVSVNLTIIGAQRLISGNSDDQTKEQRSRNTDLLCEPKSGTTIDSNCRGLKNDSESVVEEHRDGPAITKNTPNFGSSSCDQFLRPEIGSRVSKTTIFTEQERISSQRIESKDEIIEKNEESAKVDPSIQNAAILLVNMSTETNYDQPQSSSDSFEMIALKLRQNSCDDYSVSSRPIETNDGDKRDYSCKLRRGRRLKDFQKEILPGLATLSRHEICEDINILEAVLRSREYKKVSDGNKWHPPVRSKRSSVRRRLLL